MCEFATNVMTTSYQAIIINYILYQTQSNQYYLSIQIRSLLKMYECLFVIKYLYYHK